MVENLLTVVIGTTFFLYIFWKRLKEDYLPDQIFTTAVFSLVGICIGIFLAKLIAREWWFWFIAVFSLSGLLFGIFKFKLRFFEVFEAAFIGLLPWLSMVFLFHSIAAVNVMSFVVFTIIVLLLGLYYYLDTHYKNFPWYVSGRVGFAGLTTAAIFFLVRAGLALNSNPVLSLSGKLDSALSAVAAFTLCLLTYNLARNTK